MDERLQIFQDKMEKSLANLNEEFAGIRAGRANPHVLDKLRVDYYGTPSPIQSVANVSVPEPRMIQIQPWEASMVKEIEKAILSSDCRLQLAYMKSESLVIADQHAAVNTFPGLVHTARHTTRVCNTRSR